MVSAAQVDETKRVADSGKVTAAKAWGMRGIGVEDNQKRILVVNRLHYSLL
jgi:hypothetical protein